MGHVVGRVGVDEVHPRVAGEPLEQRVEGATGDETVPLHLGTFDIAGQQAHATGQQGEAGYGR